MPIDHELRSTGLGGSDIAPILGMSSTRDPFSVYCEKLGLLNKSAPNQRMKWGKLLERAIVQGYSEETGFTTTWSDVTQRHASRSWQVFTIDAFVAEKTIGLYDGICDAKNVGHDQAYLWGDPGSDDVPIHIALQLQWYCSGADKPWADVAALFGGNDLRIYRIHRDSEIESAILDSAERFWFDHVVPRVPPHIGATQAASDYLKQKFPLSIEPLRCATPAEHDLLVKLKHLTMAEKELATKLEEIENHVKLAIGASDGLLDGPAKVTWRRCADTVGPDFEALACDLFDEMAKAMNIPLTDRPSLRAAFIAKHTKVLRPGARRLHKNWGKLSR